MTDLHDLKQPFDPARVSWRVGSTTGDKKRGLAFAYIDARDVMERLDGVCGVAGWQCRYPHANGKTVCEIGIRIDSEWIWKADGAGDSDVEAEKGALSDAFKRAAVRWGIGRYLYDVEAPWVEVEAAGRSFKIKDSEHAKLRRLLGGSAPATARETAPPMQPESNASLDSHALASDLIAELRKIDTPRGLANWGASIKDKIDGLASADQQRVRDDYTSRLKTLKEAELLHA